MNLGSMAAGSPPRELRVRPPTDDAPIASDETSPPRELRASKFGGDVAMATAVTGFASSRVFTGGASGAPRGAGANIGNSANVIAAVFFAKIRVKPLIAFWRQSSVSVTLTAVSPRGT